MAERNSKLVTVIVDRINDLEADIQAVIDAQTALGREFTAMNFGLLGDNDGDKVSSVLLRFDASRGSAIASSPRVVVHSINKTIDINTELQEIIDAWEDASIGRNLISQDLQRIHDRNGDCDYRAILVFGYDVTSDVLQKVRRRITGQLFDLNLADGGAGTDAAYDHDIISAGTPRLLHDDASYDLSGLVAATIDVLVDPNAFTPPTYALLVDDDVTYTSRLPGVIGNLPTITKLHVESANVSLLITVDGVDITIRLATNASGVITTTAQQIVDALTDPTNDAFNIEAFRIVTASTGVPGTVQTALAATNLAGGLDTAAPAAVADGNEFTVAAVVVVEAGVPAIYYVVGEEALATNSVRPTPQQIRDVLAAESTWDGVAYLIDYATVVRAGAATAWTAILDGLTDRDRAGYITADI